MATRRMFAKTIVQSDAFTKMSHVAQSLYIQLNMYADDDGIVNNAEMIAKFFGAEEGLGELVNKNFVMQFPNGLHVIKHWRINNRLQNDRHKDTMYFEELAMLHIKPNKAYTFDQSFPRLLSDTELSHNLTDLDTQYSIVKESKKKVNKVEDSVAYSSKEKSKSNDTLPSEKKQAYGFFNNVLLTDFEAERLYDTFDNANTLIERASEYLAESGKAEEHTNHFKLCMYIAKEDCYRVKENEQN